MKVKFLGHSGFKLDELLVDPFTKEIPGMGLKNNYDYTQEDQRAKVVCITHNHADHRLGAEDISKEHNATVVAGFELALEFAQQGLPAEFMNIGGTVNVHGWRIHMTPATHSGSCNPSGFIFQKGGKTVYHAGDTGLFYDMKRLGDEYSIDLVLLPIGGRFTMDVEEAVKAVKLLKPKAVIPMHYNTFDLVRADPADFKKKVEALGIQCHVLQPGQEMQI